MKKLNSKEMKKILFGTLLTDGSVVGKRFSIYLRNEELIDNLYSVLETIPKIKIHKKKVHDKRFDCYGYKLWTTNSRYFDKLRGIFYPKNRKIVTKYIADRLDFQALAYAWMCDGFLEHQKNRKSNKVQNRGWFCLEGFTKEELEILVTRLSDLGIESRLSPVEWGYGYRIQISGTALQIFIDKIYPYVLESFKYKTILYYKDKNSKYILNDLSNTEHIIREYDNVDDIVRHS